MKRISHNDIIGEKLLTLFIDETPVDVEQLQSAIEDKQVELIIALAHKIKGSSRNLGADKLAKACSEIEVLAKDNQLAELLAQQSKLTTSFNQFNSKIKTYISNLKTN